MRRRLGLVPTFLTTLGVVILIAPTLIVMSTSVGTAASVQFPPDGFTLHWYVDAFETEGIRSALLNSLYVSIEAVLVGLLVGVPAALALYRRRRRFHAALTTFLSLGFIAPLIVSAVGFLLLFTELRVVGNLAAVGLAVTIINLPFMLWAVSASCAGIDPNLEDAAATLGADEVQRFLLITLPGIASGVFAGALLIFVFAFTDFVVSLLIVRAEQTTLPVFLFGSIRLGISPVFSAVATVYIVLAAIVFVAGMRLGRLDMILGRAAVR